MIILFQAPRTILYRLDAPSSFPHSRFTVMQIPIPTQTNTILTISCQNVLLTDITTPSFPSAQDREVALVSRKHIFSNRINWSNFIFTGRKYAMLKLKILLSHLLRNFKVVSDVREKDFQLQADIILKRADGFRIRLEPRKKVSA